MCNFPRIFYLSPLYSDVCIRFTIENVFDIPEKNGGGDLRNYAIAFGCAIVWVIAAFLVAYPEHIYSFDVLTLSADFTGDKLARAFIPLLIIIDIMISIFVGHYKTSQGRFSTIVIMSIVYIVLAISPDVNSELSQNAVVLIFLGLVTCLLTIRTVSFYTKDKDRNYVEIPE